MGITTTDKKKRKCEFGKWSDSGWTMCSLTPLSPSSPSPLFAESSLHTGLALQLQWNGSHYAAGGEQGLGGGVPCKTWQKLMRAKMGTATKKKAAGKFTRNENRREGRCCGKIACSSACRQSKTKGGFLQKRTGCCFGMWQGGRVLCVCDSLYIIRGRI